MKPLVSEKSTLTTLDTHRLIKLTTVSSQLLENEDTTINGTIFCYKWHCVLLSSSPENGVSISHLSI